MMYPRWRWHKWTNPPARRPRWPTTSVFSSATPTTAIEPWRPPGSSRSASPPKEYGALSVLVAEGPLTQQQLGRRTGIDRTTMVAVADALEEKGFAVRERSPADRRAYELRATAQGRRTLGRAARAMQRAEAEFLEALSERQRGQLKSMLRRLALP